MEIVVKLSFYVLAMVLHSYANGDWFNIVKNKERYEKWLEENGAKTKKGILYLIMLYTVGLLFSYL